MTHDAHVDRTPVERVTYTDGAGMTLARDNAVALAEPIIVRDSQKRAAALLHIAPPGYQVIETDIARHLGTPDRKRGTVALHNPESFITYVNTHGEPGTALWANQSSRTMTAVLNGHTSDHPGHGDHVAVYRPDRTPSWTRWSGVNGKWMLQEEFAELVEDLADTFIEPDAADMLEVARTFSAHTNVTFESGVRLENGTRQLVYKEETTAKADHVEIPERITLGLTPWKGAQGYRVPARLRYRISNGTLGLMVKIDRLEDTVDEAFGDLLDSIADPIREALPDLVVVHGQL